MGSMSWIHWSSLAVAPLCSRARTLSSRWHAQGTGPSGARAEGRHQSRGEFRPSPAATDAERKTSPIASASQAGLIAPAGGHTARPCCPNRLHRTPRHRRHRPDRVGPNYLPVMLRSGAVRRRMRSWPRVSSTASMNGPIGARDLRKESSHAVRAAPHPAPGPRTPATSSRARLHDIAATEGRSAYSAALLELPREEPRAPQES